MTVTLKFGGTRSYAPLPLDPTPRPYLPVRLQHGGQHVDTVALVDSGADCAYFNSAIATRLGFALDPGAAQTASGIGTAQYWRFTVRLIVGGQAFDANVAFSPTYGAAYGLLGQADFFAHFRVAFERSSFRFHYHSVATP